MSGTVWKIVSVETGWLLEYGHRIFRDPRVRVMVQSFGVNANALLKMNPAAGTKQDIINWIEERFSEAAVVEVAEDQFGQVPVRVLIEGITKEEQNWIQEELSKDLPIGVKIDVQSRAAVCQTCNGLGRLVTRHDPKGGQTCPACGGDKLQGPRSDDWDKTRGSYVPIRRTGTLWDLDD